MIWQTKASRIALGATDSGGRPWDYPFGSPRSRAAARALLVFRLTEELSCEVRSIVDGSRVNLDGLAEAIRDARMRNRDAELPVSLRVMEGGYESMGEGVQSACQSASERPGSERQRRKGG
jgi:hypothetical protein